MLKVYSDRAFLPDGVVHAPFFYPFWGEVTGVSGHPTEGRYDRYIERARQSIELSSVQEADCVVLPAAWEHVRYNVQAENLAQKLAAKARESGKRMLVFYSDDATSPVPIEEAIVLRTSLERSNRTDNEFAMPAWSEDFVERYLGGELPIRSKEERPKVGFCGAIMNQTQYALLLLRRTARQLAHHSGLRQAKGAPTNPSGHILRNQTIKSLQSSNLLDADFVLRHQFWGGVAGSSVQHMERMRVLRAEYVRNMLDTDYTLCIRGSGNYSYRLYETLCCGRIPIFVNTDSVLPFDFSVKWKEYVVWIEQGDLSRIDEIIRAFHDSISPDTFMQRQYACRELWQKLLSPEGFFSHMWQHLDVVD